MQSADTLHPVNDKLDEARDLMASFSAWVVNLADYLSGIDVLLHNSIYIAVTTFFNAIYNALKPFINLLYRRIGVSVPIPGWATKRVCTTIRYPCGTRWCRSESGGCVVQLEALGWGWKLSCRSRYCNVSYPCGLLVLIPGLCLGRLSHDHGSTSPRPRHHQGALSVLNIVVDALMSLLKSLIPGLPSLNFNFPGLPEAFDLSILTDI